MPASSLTGTTVPNELDTCVTASSFVLAFITEAAPTMSTAPSSVRSRNLSAAPFLAAILCQGTRLLWCSRRVTTISSPSEMLLSAQLCATRLIDSVALRVQMIDSGVSALMKRATFSRASSYRSVASMLRVCTPRWTLELYVS